MDEVPILQTDGGGKIDDGNGASVDAADRPAATSWRERLLEPAEPTPEMELPPEDDGDATVALPTAPVADEPADLPGESLVRRLHAATTAAALEESRGADGLEAVWQMRDQLRASQRLRRQKLKLRR